MSTHITCINWSMGIHVCHSLWLLYKVAMEPITWTLYHSFLVLNNDHSLLEMYMYSSFQSVLRFKTFTQIKWQLQLSFFAKFHTNEKRLSKVELKIKKNKYVFYMCIVRDCYFFITHILLLSWYHLLASFLHRISSSQHMFPQICSSLFCCQVLWCASGALKLRIFACFAGDVVL